MILNLVLVGLGGSLGAILRYLGSLASDAMLGSEFPFGSLLVNVSGCFIMGIAAAFLIGKAPGRAQLFLLTGIAGGYTTFSAYALDGFRLLQSGQYAPAAQYLIGVPVLSVAAFVAGFALSRVLAS